MTMITREAIHAMIEQCDLIHVLGRLAAHWRYAGMHERAEEQASVQEVYAATIHRLFDLGYDDPGALDVESELPDAFMPHEYLVRYPTL